MEGPGGLTMDSLSQTSVRRFSAKRGESRPNPLVLLLLATFPLLLLELVPVPLLTNFEWAVYDQRLRLRNRLDPRPIDSSIRLVGVGAADEERLDTDLHNRQSYMELMALLRQWGSAGVVYDLFFDRELATDQLFATSLSAGPPTTLAYSFLTSRSGFEPAGDIPPDFVEADELAAQGTDPTEVADFIRAIDSFLFDLRSEELRLPRNDAHAAELTELRRLIAWSREIRDRLQDRWLWLTAGRPYEETPHADPFSADHLRRIAPSVLLAAPSHGFANIEKDRQDVVRMAPLVYRHEGRLFPQLSLAAALVHFDVPFTEVEIIWGRHLRFSPRRNGTGDVVLPIDDRGRYLINFREGEAYLNRQPTLSALLLPELREEMFPEGPDPHFRDAIVIVGEVISGGAATDVEPIPLQTQFPMVGIHANILDNIIKRDVLLLAPWWAGILVAFLLGGAAAVAYHRYRFIKASFVTGGVLLIYLLGEMVLFIYGGVVLNVVKPVAGLTIGGLLLFGYVIGAKDRDRRLVRDVFLKSVSPRIGEEILNHYYDEAIWGARREITVLFIDVRGYTTISEAHPPRCRPRVAG